MRRIDDLHDRKQALRGNTDSVRPLETLGLILIVLLILALTVSRSWHYMSWSAR